MKPCDFLFFTLGDFVITQTGASNLVSDFKSNKVLFGKILMVLIHKT